MCSALGTWLTQMLCLLVVYWCAACSSPTRADALPSFGRVEHGASVQPIDWEASTSAQITFDALRLVRPRAFARSAELPLSPLQLYEISATMQRGPGTSPRFTATYEDALGAQQVWFPTWQFLHATRAGWLPLSPRPQTYVQGFILPLGATKPRLQLQIDAPPANSRLASYSRWELTQLRIVALQAVRCCQRLGNDRLIWGDMESPGAADGLPAGWEQWGVQPDNRVERIALSAEPARRHVLRVKAGTNVLLAAKHSIPVTRGSAWRISAVLRGSGQVGLVAHSLSDDTPQPLRVSNSFGPMLGVRATTWTQLGSVWFAEAANVATAQVFVGINASTTMEIDSIEFRPYE